MSRIWIWPFVVILSMARAEAPTAQLSLEQYLQAVRSQNPEARAASETIASNEKRIRETELLVTPEVYAQFGVNDDKRLTAFQAFMGDETRVTGGRLGLRQQTEYGLGANLFFAAQRTNLAGVDIGFVPNPDYMETSANLQLTQSIWRNGFGEGTRAQIDANKATVELTLLQARFNLKNILLNAENAYWSLVSYNQIVRLQEENIERARRLRDYMATRTRMKLFEDTDAMQAEASYQSRQLELQNSLDDRAVIVRQFNTLRGVDSDEIPGLQGLPTEEMMQRVSLPPNGHMSREDFDMLRAQAKVGVATAKQQLSQTQPQLDVSGGVSTNGRDGVTTVSEREAETSRYPVWSIGLIFSMPLDVSLVRQLHKGYHEATESAHQLQAQADFTEKRAWDDVVRRKTEALGRFDRARGVEKIQTELVKREHARLINGRATTFEAINFEQNLALAQIQRVQAQLVLLQLYNAIQTFEAKP